jgi:hypothetical protein
MSGLLYQQNQCITRFDSCLFFVPSLTFSWQQTIFIQLARMPEVAGNVYCSTVQRLYVLHKVRIEISSPFHRDVNLLTSYKGDTQGFLHFLL